MNILNIRIVFDRRAETKSNPKKAAMVHIEVLERQSKRKKYIYTGVKILASQYSPNGSFSVKNHPNALILKSKVFEVYNKIEAFIHSDKCTCLDDMDNWGNNDANITFLEFFQKELDKKVVEYTTKKSHKALLNGLVRFGRIKHFKDITYANIADFDVFLKQTLKSQPTLYKRHKLLSSYIKEAKRRGFAEYNPYDEFQCKKGKHKDPIVLNEEELKKIINCHPTLEKIEKVRDMFLFQCLTGMAYVDMQAFSKDKISHIDGSMVINSQRVKTEESFIIPLFAEAQEILEKYDYSFPKISNQKYNDYIKVLASYAGIEKRLTSHSGRHTYATYLINKGVPVTVIQRALGHAKITQTIEYAKISATSVKNGILEIGQNNRFVS